MKNSRTPEADALRKFHQENPEPPRGEYVEVPGRVDGAGRTVVTRVYKGERPAEYAKWAR